ncbi:putative aig2-like protein [Neofusicoccum parvum UCRNP2]|uniref:Putative gamma-glutamylcyclotransferase n=1 Tax=Botryosphaeria parva (strain UCR-NP2) TaxID=1287680 RepID=R1EX93_BOTPV|nr:putative aig2-like protein [Neofusicoccum parvum UCRNP2]
MIYGSVSSLNQGGFNTKIKLPRVQSQKTTPNFSTSGNENMDFLTDELERMAVNLAEYTGPELGSEVPLDDISGEASRDATITTSGGRASGGNASSIGTGSSTSGSHVSIGSITSSVSSNSEYLMTSPNLRSLLTQLSSNSTIPPLPPPITGTAEDGTPTLFLRIPATTKRAIETYLASSSTGSRPPTFIRLSIAHKDLSPHSAHPTLGIDATLPQHRGPGRRPHQDEYPVWYFFYGTLADPETLARLFDLAEGEQRPVLKPAIIHGGRMEMWAGKYRALVDGAERVEGWACRVQSREHEDALLVYETDSKYMNAELGKY